MSDAMGSDDLVGQLNDLGSEPDPGDSGVVQEEGPKLSAFAQNYLNTVPDEERAMVERHVQQWDKGFSKYAENISRKYGQYDQLGEFEQVQQAVQLAQLISSDPDTATRWLMSQGYGQQQAQQVVQNQQAQQGVPQQPGQPGQPGQQPEWIPPAVQRELQRYQMALGAMNQRFENDQFTRETERYQSEIEAGLAAVKQEHPNIPEILILHLMKGGMDMDDAVTTIVEQIQTGVNQRSAPTAPKVLSSASLPPQAAKAPSEMTDDERKASLLAALQGAMQ